MSKEKLPDFTDPKFYVKAAEILSRDPDITTQQKKEISEIGQQAKKSSERINAQLGATKYNSRQPIKITSEQCGDMLYDWLRLHCNSKAFKAMSKDVAYRYSIFSPSKKNHLMEELVFLYVSLAIFGVNDALDDNSTIESVVHAFLEKSRKNIFTIMASDDEEFQNRYSDRVSSYFELLRSGGDAIGVAGIFLEGLFGTIDSRLKMQPSIKVSVKVVNAQNLLDKLFQKIKISGESDF